LDKPKSLVFTIFSGHSEVLLGGLSVNAFRNFKRTLQAPIEAMGKVMVRKMTTCLEAANIRGYTTLIN
jgi:hypothetical protein